MAADEQACLAFMVRFALFIVCKAKKHLYFYKNICTGRRFCVSNATRPACQTLADIIRKSLKIKILQKLKKNTILILIAFFCNFLFSKFADKFRFNTEFRWIYSYGKPTTILLFIVLLILSLSNGILIMKETNIKFLTRLFWTILCISIFLYFTISMSIIMQQ